MTTTHPLQTSAWADFRKAWGNEIVKTRFGYLTLHKIPLTKFKVGMFIKGPAPTAPMLRELKELGKKEHVIFFKLEPNVQKDPQTIKRLVGWGALPGKTLFTPTTFWVDLTKSEDEILKSFSPKTRYNIRLAQRRGVSIKLDGSDKAFGKYLELTQETAKRQGFYAHTKRYHQLMWKYLKPAGIAHLLTATYQGEIVTTWILFSHDGFLYYPYGASSDRHRGAMANNLMMWEAVKFGKRSGLSTFDLWGREEGKGFTRFKEGYNPKVVELLGTWDVIINKPLYAIYQLAEKIRWFYLHLRR